MRVVRLGALARRPVDAHGSSGFTVGGLGITADAHLVTIRVKPGGVIGRHPAAGRQLLVVVDGDATVSGDDGRTADLGPGEAAVWEPREQHETRTVGGLLALVVEGDVDIAGDAADLDA